MARYLITAHPPESSLEGTDQLPIIAASARATTIILTDGGRVIRVQLDQNETAQLLGKIIKGRSTTS